MLCGWAERQRKLSTWPMELNRMYPCRGDIIHQTSRPELSRFKQFFRRKQILIHEAAPTVPCLVNDENMATDTESSIGYRLFPTTLTNGCSELYCSYSHFLLIIVQSIEVLPSSSTIAVLVTGCCSSLGQNADSHLVLFCCTTETGHITPPRTHLKSMPGEIAFCQK